MCITKRFDLCFVLGWKSFEVFLFNFFHVCASFSEHQSPFTPASCESRVRTPFWCVLNKHGLRSYNLSQMNLPCKLYHSVFHLTSHWHRETHVAQRGEPKQTGHDSCRWVSLATVTRLELMPDFHPFSVIWVLPRRGVLKRGNTDANEKTLSNRDLLHDGGWHHLPSRAHPQAWNDTVETTAEGA